MTHQHDQYDQLSPHDQRLLDALVECEFDPEALELLSAADRRRVDAIMDLFELLNDYPVEDADETLVHATLARIDRHEERASARLAFDATQAQAGDVPRGRRIRMPDFITIAAVILIAASVIWPTTNFLRQRTVDAGCANNLRLLGVAFNHYASDYDGAMPVVAQAGMFNGWSTKAHNELNLNPLLEAGYCEIGHLDCPGNHNLDPSYSYQWQLSDRPMVWGVGRITLALGDRNPMVDAARAGRWVPALSISLNHNGRGQNVLATDGAWIWLVQPLFGSSDNIWLPMGVLFLRPGDQPIDSNDIFLAH